MRTAMQELLSEISNPNWDRLSFDTRYEIFDKLLNLEKEQIMDFFLKGYSIGESDLNPKAEFGKYYDQTYNQNK